MVSTRRLRQMQRTVERYEAELEKFADGDFHTAWSDKDQARRSLAEAAVYLRGWADWRKRHGGDPAPGQSLAGRACAKNGNSGVNP